MTVKSLRRRSQKTPCSWWKHAAEDNEAQTEEVKQARVEQHLEVPRTLPPLVADMEGCEDESEWRASSEARTTTVSLVDPPRNQQEAV
jgi:hypothetical protein